jgi:hypothetical protein
MARGNEGPKSEQTFLILFGGMGDVIPSALLALVASCVVKMKTN